MIIISIIIMIIIIMIIVVIYIYIMCACCTCSWLASSIVVPVCPQNLHKTGAPTNGEPKFLNFPHLRSLEAGKHRQFSSEARKSVKKMTTKCTSPNLRAQGNLLNLIRHSMGDTQWRTSWQEQMIREYGMEWGSKSWSPVGWHLLMSCANRLA